MMQNLALVIAHWLREIRPKWKIKLTFLISPLWSDTSTSLYD